MLPFMIMEKNQQGDLVLRGHDELITANAAVEWIMHFKGIREAPLSDLPELEKSIQEMVSESEYKNQESTEQEEEIYVLDQRHGSLLIGIMSRATIFLEDRQTAEHMYDMLAQVDARPPYPRGR
jgi:hypothetical protein